MGVPYAEVIGDPIAHSKSPLIHKFWLEKLGIAGDYRAIRIAGGDLKDYFESRRADPKWLGCNVTIPHKQAVMSALDEVEDDGIGAVNCVIPRDGRLVGSNTDGAGVAEATKKAVDTDVPMCLIGTGGAARAVVSSLDILAVYQWNIIARDPAKAQAILDQFAMKGRVFDFDRAEAALAGAAGAVNASPLGMAGFPPMPETVLRGLAGMRRRALVIEMVYTPLRTAFLRAAESSGFAPRDGLTVLMGQAARAFYLFFGAFAPREHDAELRAMLTR
jgi:shikimate dehydrogenase